MCYSKANRSVPSRSQGNACNSSKPKVKKDLKFCFWNVGGIVYDGMNKLDDDMFLSEIKAYDIILLAETYIAYDPSAQSINTKNLSTDILQLLEKDILHFKSKGDVLLCGDFNARCGNLLDFVSSDSADHLPINNDDYPVDFSLNVRNSRDTRGCAALVSRISGKALKFYKNRSYTVQADYETLCKLYNDRFDSVGYPCLILENLENIFPYPDELLDEFTDRIEELVEGAFQNESENAKEHLVIEYLTNACCKEEGKELVKAVAEGSVYEAKRYLCVLSKVTAKRYLKNQSLWEPIMEKKRDDTNLKIEKTENHSPVMMIGQGTEQTAPKG
ncbi:unnamed protein product [Mytilus coruscus]|uniref:Endonuclease/exonuclease/phosphatase domain-containing protein n=1 Tax=Mytilus coruscus TaxID=42192 RepID=A0A6J8CD18_MYTCO|nr:unnamed protein product [Mytilus coruscus]